MVSGTCTGSAGFNIKSVKVNGISQSSSCYGSANTDVYRFWGATTSFIAGYTYTMEVVTPQSSLNVLVSSGFWIDFDQDSTFDSLELVKAGLGYNGKEITHIFKFVVPCNAKSGTTRMRVRSQGYTAVKGNHACAAAMNYGETWDFAVSIVQPTSANAGFTATDTVFTKTSVKFTNVNRDGYLQHAWDANNDGTIDGQGIDFSYTWSSTGTKCVKLRSTNCYGKDSATKCVVVIAPTAKPVADFKSCQRIIQQYESVQLFDASTNGPWSWEWDIYDSSGAFPSLVNGGVYSNPSGNGNNEFSKNPEFAFDVPGTYSVILKVKNDVGSSMVTKKYFIKVVLPTEYNLGYGTYGNNHDNRVSSNDGSIYDDGGPRLNYGNNQGVSTKSYLAIVPENGGSVTLDFQQVRFGDINDSLKIYDDDKVNASKLLGVLTSVNNGTYPTFTSTTNKMYILFTSNGSGTDSGYQAIYYADGFGPGVKAMALAHNVLVTGTNSRFYNKNRTKVSENSYNRWKVDNVIQPAYNGLDTLKYVFTDTVAHTVCLEASNCDTIMTVCERLVFDLGIMGRTYMDVNSNCVWDSGDKPMNNVRIKLYDSVSNLLAQYSSFNGAYDFIRGKGKYKVMVDTSDVPYEVGCTYPGIDSIVRLTNSITLAQDVDFDIRCRAGFDVGVRSIVPQGIVFPGRYHDLHINAGDLTSWYGLKCATGKSGTVKITINGKVNYFSKSYGSLTPSVSGNIYTYTIADFGNLNASSAFGLFFKTDTSANTGDTIHVRVEVTPTSGDRDTTNNKKNMFYLVRNSYDPNMKEVYPVDVPPLYNNWMTYTVHFQNTGSAPAYNIRLADTLASQFDLETFEVLDYSHTMNTILTGRALSFRFPNIMLPDSFSDSKGSQGFVQYRIKPKSNLPEGTKIYNTAYIYFDYNAPVLTNTTVNAFVKNSSSISTYNYINSLDIYPNPNTGVFKLKIPESLKGKSHTIEVYNVLGELLYSTQTDQISVQIDMSAQGAGVYVVKVNGIDYAMNAYMIKQ